MKINNFFHLQEFIPKAVYNEYGEFATRFIDSRMVKAATFLRRIHGPIVINDYLWGGQRQWRGLRTPFSAVGGDMSQHRFGRALDLTFIEANHDEVREAILKNQSYWKDECGITRLELGVPHVHIDCAWTMQPGIEIFRPKEG